MQQWNHIVIPLMFKREKDNNSNANANAKSKKYNEILWKSN